MSEQLIIRLGSDSSQTVHWLVWSTEEKEIIASGTLADAAGLITLQAHAGGRIVITLVPSCDITFKQVLLPARSNKQLLNALPYMLEQELSCDIDQLHFAVLAKKANIVSVAIVAHDKMQLWLSWLASAELECAQFIPDTLTLPFSDDTWHAVRLEEQWLIRQSQTQGICIETALLPFVLATKHDVGDDQQVQLVNSYSSIAELPLDHWQQVNIELPMKLCAEGAVANSYNLLQGQYQIVHTENTTLKLWRGTAIAAGLAVVMVFVNQFVMLQQLKQQQTVLESDIKQVYKTVFNPQKMRLNTRLVKKQMQNRLTELQRGGDHSGFLLMLSQLTPAFKQTPSIQPLSMRFDSKQDVLRLQVNATDFQNFDTFKTAISANFVVSQGILSQAGGKVQGSLDIKGTK